MAMAALLPWNARPADKLPVLGDSKAAQGSKPAQKEQAAKPDPGGFDLIISDGMITWNGMKVKIEPTLGHVVDTLRERYAEANIAISPGLSELRVGDLKLRARNLPEELEAIRVASGSQFEWLGPGSAGPNMGPLGAVDPTTGLPKAAPSESSAGLFVLREPTPTPENQRIVEAFNLSGYVQWLMHNSGPKEAKEDRGRAEDARMRAAEGGVQEIEKIVAETIEMLKRSHPANVEIPSFRFHHGANLLVVVGTSQEVDVVRKVVTGLPGQAVPRDERLFDLGTPAVTSPEDAFRRRYGLAPSPGQGAAIDGATGLPVSPPGPAPRPVAPPPGSKPRP